MSDARERGPWYLRLDGLEDVRFASRASAITECNRIQAELDEDKDGRRAFVVDSFGMAVHAGARQRVSQQ
jgi:hypothetical protein